MVKLTKKCNNCQLTIDIDLNTPPSICPYCGKELLYSVEETKQINNSEKSVISENPSERRLALRGSDDSTIFTVSKPKDGLKIIITRVIVVLAAMAAGYFLISAITGSNDTQQQASISASSDSEIVTLQVQVFSTTTPTPKPTATEIPMIHAPALAEHYIDRKYEEVRMDFKNAGFTKIILYPLHDMAIDIGATHVGNVESISINGNINYNTETLYPVDAVVKISYHSMK